MERHLNNERSSKLNSRTDLNSAWGLLAKSKATICTCLYKTSLKADKEVWGVFFYFAIELTTELAIDSMIEIAIELTIELTIEFTIELTSEVTINITIELTN